MNLLVAFFYPLEGVRRGEFFFFLLFSMKFYANVILISFHMRYLEISEML